VGEHEAVGRSFILLELTTGYQLRGSKDECIVHRDFPKNLQKKMEDLVDAFLYLGPQDLRLREQMPADIALDVDYRMELKRRDALPGFPAAVTGTLREADQQIVNGAENPVFVIPKSTVPDPSDPALKRVVQNCLDHLKRRSTPTQ
jgi:hypothetical protein